MIFVQAVNGKPVFISSLYVCMRTCVLHDPVTLMFDKECK
jgi:hypothetical protein